MKKKKMCAFMDDDMCGVVLDMLKEWAKEYPLELI
jgi:hypothetical protein